MKATHLAFAVVMAFTASVHSQEVEKAVTQERAGLPGPARILGGIPDGTPPPARPVKPAFVVPAKDILTTTRQQQGGRTITIHKINPIDLPPPPEPAHPDADFDDTAFKAHLAEYRAKYPEPRVLFVGATVYRSKNAAPRTLVRYWYGANAEPVTFWSTADFALMSGILSFVGTDGHTRSLFMMWGNVDIERTAARYASIGREFHPPVIPDLPVGPATFTFVGNQPPAGVLVPIQSLHDIYNAEFARLRAAYDGRERARIQRDADLKANPPRPKDITFSYWRSERPAPAKGGVK